MAESAAPASPAAPAAAGSGQGASDPTPLPPIELLAIGSPLLDIIADVSDPEEFCSKYKVKKAGFCFWDKDTHADLYESALKTPGVRFVPGGATQNIARVATALINKRNVAALNGCVGHDEYADIMRKKMAEEGLISIYEESSKNTPTGVCLVSLWGGDRSMVTRLGAAEDYTMASFESAPVAEALAQAKVIVSDGFYITVSPSAMIKAAQHACEKGKWFVSGLAAPFIVTTYFEQLTKLFEFTSVIAGNTEEWLTFGKMANVLVGDNQNIRKNCNEKGVTDDEYQSDLEIEAIISFAVRMPYANSTRPRIVVCTQGKRPTIVALQSGGKAADGGAAPAAVKIQHYDVDEVPSEIFVDANAAGDAFMGGFVTGLLKDLPIERCMELAHFAAREIVQNDGCTFDFGPYLPALQ